MSKSPLRVVYIAGLSRGGSTVLQRYLATHPDFVSGGESHFALRVLIENADPEHEEWPCSCGKAPTDCELWGPLIADVANNGDTANAHAQLMARVQSLYPGRILIDSSKDIRGLKLYLDKARSGEIGLQVIFLVRDVRSWASAILKYRSGLSSFVLESYRWMKATLNMLRVIRSADVNCYCLSFEAFVFDPEGETAKLAQWLRVANQFSEERMVDAASHELYGSGTTRTNGKSERLAYDDAWLRDLRPTLLGPLLFPPLLLNWYIYRSLAGKPMIRTATARARSETSAPPKGDSASRGVR